MNMRIIAHGNDARCRFCRDALISFFSSQTDELAPGCDALHILPIQSTTDGVCIRGTPIPLSSTLAPRTALVGYALPAALKEEAARVGCTVHDVSDDETFTLENAHLTAVGTLGYLLTHQSCAPKDLCIGILGFGRIGRELARLLLPLGASLRVYTSKEPVRHALGRCGIESASSIPGEDGAPLSFDGLDLLINTAPAPSLIRADSQGLPPLVLELASGQNMDDAVGAVRLPSLPALMYPESAGQAYARAALRAIRNPSEKGEVSL